MSIRLLVKSTQVRCSASAILRHCTLCGKTWGKTLNQPWHRGFSNFNTNNVKADSTLCISNEFLSITRRQFSTCSPLFSKSLGEKYEDGTLIYIGQLEKSVKRSHLGFFLTGAFVICSSPVLLSHVPPTQLMTFCVATYAFFFGILNPALFYNFAKRYVHELYHNEEKDEYTAHVSSPFVVNNKKIVFSPHACKMPEKASAFISFYVNNIPLFINSNDMNYRFYSSMLRYASEFDYENPERQAQYRDAVKESIDRISNENNKEK